MTQIGVMVRIHSVVAIQEIQIQQERLIVRLMVHQNQEIKDADKLSRDFLSYHAARFDALTCCTQLSNFLVPFLRPCE